MKDPRRWLPLLLLALSACDDGGADEPTLAALWPNQDGSSWTYAYVERVWDEEAIPPTYPTEAEVPPPPPLAELADFFPTHEPGSPLEVREATYRLTFDGLLTTESGVTAQNLVDELEPVVPASPAARVTRPAGAFLERLWAARPDLHDRLRAEGLVPSRPARGADVAFRPLFLPGYAWERTADWIGLYGDLDQDPSWKFLIAELSPGTEFTHQLVPAVTDNVFLHARMLPRQSVSTPLGVFEDCVVCLYLVDYGMTSVADSSGLLIGYAQSISYGTVAYAAGVGPVYSYERVLTSTGAILPPGAGDLTLRLAERTVPGD